LGPIYNSILIYCRNSPADLEYITPQVETDPTDKEDEWGVGDAVFLKVTVTDTGRGMTEMEKALVFARFTQASPRTHVKYGGSGLGLFISRRLSELQGGAIGFTSQTGVGSVFSYYIKARKFTGHVPQAHLPSTAAFEEGNKWLISGPSTPSILSSPVSGDYDLSSHQLRRTSMPRKPLTILVVEDNLINQKMLAKQLQRQGCTVIVANHGLEAIDQISDTKFGGNEEQDLSVVLLDWEMPVMDGLTCVRRIRELEHCGTILGHVPVIGVTANARTAQLEMAINAGMVSLPTPSYR
jgi:CheY-like chemotaxis protein